MKYLVQGQSHEAVANAYLYDALGTVAGFLLFYLVANLYSMDRVDAKQTSVSRRVNPFATPDPDCRDTEGDVRRVWRL